MLISPRRARLRAQFIHLLQLAQSQKDQSRLLRRCFPPLATSAQPEVPILMTRCHHSQQTLARAQLPPVPISILPTLRQGSDPSTCTAGAGKPVVGGCPVRGTVTETLDTPHSGPVAPQLPRTHPVSIRSTSLSRIHSKKLFLSGRKIEPVKSSTY